MSCFFTLSFVVFQSDLSLSCLYLFLFFFNDTATTGIYTDLHTLSLHDALPIYRAASGPVGLLDPLAAHDEGAVGEVGALDPLDERVLQLLAGGDRKSTRLNSSH